MQFFVTLAHLFAKFQMQIWERKSKNIERMDFSDMLLASNMYKSSFFTTDLYKFEDIDKMHTDFSFCASCKMLKSLMDKFLKQQEPQLNHTNVFVII